jgi:serine/threonine protein kinase
VKGASERTSLPLARPSELPRRDVLHANVVRVLSRGGVGNPDVLLVRHAGAEAVLKDYAPRRWPMRHSIGRLVTWLEARAWQALAEHPAVPRFIARVDPLALLVEHRPGRKLSARRPIPAGFLDELERAIEGMHRLGVVHLDLSHRSNVLIDAAGHPVLIDFGSAISLKPGGWPARLLLPWLARLDQRALAKWRRKLPVSEASAASR